MKLRVRTRLVIIGISVLLMIGYIGFVILREQQFQRAILSSINDQTAQTTAEAGMPTTTKDSVVTVSKSSQGMPLSHIKQQVAGFSNDPNKAEGYAVKNNEKNKAQDNMKDELSSELKRKTEEYAKLAEILPALKKLKKELGEGGTNEGSNEDSSITYRVGDPEGEAALEEFKRRSTERYNKWVAGLRELAAIHQKISDMFPDLKLYETWYDPSEDVTEHMGWRVNGNRLVEYFGKKLPWDGNTDFSKAKAWDGKSDWND